LASEAVYGSLIALAMMHLSAPVLFSRIA